MSDPYSDPDRTDFFRVLTAIGPDVQILATQPSSTPMILGGASGAGNTLVIGYDWADNSSIANSDTEQLILNAVEFEASSTAVPEPSSLVLLGIGGIALVGFGARRKRQQAA